MNKLNRIIIDTFGSDKGPSSVIMGGLLLLKTHPDLYITFVGDEMIIKKELSKSQISDLSHIHIIHTNVAVSNFDNPTTAIFQKSDASIFLAERTLADDDQAIGLLTAGSSGSILMGSYRYLANQTLTRPCMASILPSCRKGEFVCLVDTGSTIDCLPTQLHEFARLGRDLMKQLYKIESPKIGLLSNGAESSKGNKLVKETYGLLSTDPDLNFVGNIEGNNALSGDCDVLVADGFAGNMVLKV
ncbi:MAG: phosphate acyltransferase PlsX, partial [Bacilli bacterium]